MKIEHITIDNVLGAKAIDVPITTPVTFIVGGNGAGKSSVLDAVRLALTGEPARGVNFKKDFAQLMSEGMSAGQAQVRTDRATTDQHDCWLMLPKGKGEQLPEHPALPIVLDPARVAAMKPIERKGLLFGLLGVKSSTAEVKPLMAARQLDPKKCERVLPMLRAGFEDAASVASEAATQAKGAWKQVTNEQWGCDKGSNWTQEKPTNLDAGALTRLTAEASALDRQVADAQQTLGGLRNQRQHADELAKKRTDLTAKAELLDRAKKKLEHDEQELAKAEADLARCPGEKREGLVHELAWAVDHLVRYGESLDPASPTDARCQAAMDAYVKAHGPIDPSFGDIDPDRVPAIKASVQLLTNSVANDKRDLAEAESAKAQLEALKDLAAPVKESDIQAAETLVKDLQAKRSALTNQIDTQNAAKRAAESAEANTVKAAQLHTDVMQWLAIAEALGPNGIPGELVSKALGPVNERMAQSAQDTGWAPTRIGNDMAITYGGRAYQLLSESEKWRVDAMLGEAVAQVSGLRLLALDRFDVLELSARAQALTWLSTLAINNEINTVLVGATLKSADGPWPEGISAVWVSKGMCQRNAPVRQLEAA